ncbi:MAG: methyl-accepting chemotaxis protein [Clostridiales Family XIII bacterium]|jgi:methyl-accepting chemotaxis protein|nr:methyl-accepting chemotaxis protein [Clostridiales Family XIII bacterium]
MKNMKIRTKLLTGFLIVAALALLVGMVGLLGMRNITESIGDVNRVSTIAIRAGQLMSNIQEQRSAFRGVALKDLYGREAAAREDQQRLDALDAEFEDALAKIGEDAQSPEALALHREVGEVYSAYKALRTANVTMLLESDLSNEDHFAVVSALSDPVQSALTAVNKLLVFGNSAADSTSEASIESGHTMSVVQLVIAIVSIITAVIFGVYIANSISSPTKKLVAAAEQLSSGGVDVSLDIDTRDEIGELAGAFRTMAAGVKKQAMVLAHVAEGDYRESIEVRSGDDIINRSINTVIDKNNETLIGIKEAAAQVSAGATQIANGAQGLASGASQQAATLQEFSQSVSEVLKQSEENTEKAQNAYGDVQESSRHMVASMESMHSMTDAMHEINESSNNIAKVIKVIDDIAFQTNILALNAAVEAARAGAHGKGFAVVADEVRNLASKSAEAARETAELIEGSANKVAEGNSIAMKTGESLERVNHISEKNAVAMQEISEMSGRQSESMHNITSGIGQISSVVQANSATAEESAAAAQQLSAQATMLEDILSGFRLKGKSPGAASATGAAGEAGAYVAARPAAPVIDLGSEPDKY